MASPTEIPSIITVMCLVRFPVQPYPKFIIVHVCFNLHYEVSFL